MVTDGEILAYWKNNPIDKETILENALQKANEVEIDLYLASSDRELIEKQFIKRELKEYATAEIIKERQVSLD